MDESGDAVDPGSLATQLKRLRQRRGLTQRQLAPSSRVSERAIQDLEGGRSRHPQFHTLTCLADALVVTEAERQALWSLARPSSSVAPERPGVPAAQRHADAPDPDDEAAGGAGAREIVFAEEALRFEEEVKQSALEHFDVRGLGPGEHADFIVFNSYGNAAVEVKLVMNARLLARYLELSTTIPQECMVVVCRELAPDFVQAWRRRPTSDARLIVVQHAPGAFAYLSSIFTDADSAPPGPLELYSTLEDTSATVALGVVGGRSRRLVRWLRRS